MSDPRELKIIRQEMRETVNIDPVFKAVVLAQLDAEIAKCEPTEPETLPYFGGWEW